MSKQSVSAAFERVRKEAVERWACNDAGKRRIAVQVGHCSQAVGAAEVASALLGARPRNACVLVAGCDGACFNAPQVVVTEPNGVQRRFARVTPGLAARIAAGRWPGEADDAFFGKQHRISLDCCGEIDCTDINDYILHGGYEGLYQALKLTPQEVIEEVKASGLRGRGGAYFPAALKWQSARAVGKTPRYLVVNAEEGEPGIFKDRHLMEGVPHRIVEGAIIAAYAAGASKAYVYINAEADLSAQRMQQAIDQAYSRGLLGKDILDSGFSLEMEVRRGAGGYVCGEETTLLNTIEGYRREPRLRPPFPTEAGLWGKPTVINNVETLASVPYVLASGAQAYAEVGTEGDKGTKIISLSGSVQRPGLAEVAMGTTLRQVIFDIGGGPPPGHTLTAIAVGGPSSGVLPVSMLDTPIKGGLLHQSGVMLGAGGVIALDERTSVLEVVRRLAAYNAAESCGKCTPCREGTPRMVEVLDRLLAGKGSPADLEELRYLAQVVGAASLCGLGQAAGNPITSSLHFFGDQIAMMAGARS